MVAKAVPLARDVFLQAVEQHSPEQWSSFLDTACGFDDQLRAEVDRLLDAHGTLGSFMAQPVTQPSSVNTVDELLEKEIGRYKLLEELGEGGMGVVYLAEQTEPVRRRVALKLIKPGMDSRQIVGRFEAERQALALMDHPNIARVLDGGSTPQGRPYFVMELVPGPPITDFCDAQQLTIRARLELFIQICRAVQHAHQKGIIHRDLKPSNVLVALQDNLPVPKVIDFGVAKAINQPLTDETIFTQSAQVLGTPMYMSPEQAAGGNADVDTRSDVYSLGVLLYELLTGTTPFDRDTLRRHGFDELRRMIREEEPAQPSRRLSTLAADASSTISERRSVDARRLGRTLRGELDWIVMKTLEKDRTRRYQSAADLAEDVQRFLDHRPVEASPPSTWYRFRKYVRRNRAAIAVSSTIVLVLLAATGISSWQAYDAHRARGQAVNNLNTANTARNDADRQRKRAEASYKKARETIKDLLAKVAKEDVAAVPGMRELHTRLMDDAVRAYGDLIAINPDDAENYYDRGYLRMWRAVAQAPVNEEYFEDAEKAVQLNPNNSEYHRFLGEQLMWRRGYSQDELGRALTHLDKAVELDPSNPETVPARARVYMMLNRAAEARRELERLEQLPKAIAGNWANAALIFQELGHDKLADSYVQKAIALGPSDVWSHIMHGQILAAQGHTDETIAAYSEAIRNNPYVNDYSIMRNQAHYGRADAYLRKNMYAEALADFTTIVEMNPNADYPYLHRGDVHLRMKNYAEAQADYNAFIRMSPTQSTVYKRRAETHFHLKDYAKALADLRTAHESNPNDKSGLFSITLQTVFGCPDESFVEGFFALAADDKKSLRKLHEARGNYHCDNRQYDAALDDLKRFAELSQHPLSWRESDVAWRIDREGGKHRERLNALFEAYVETARKQQEPLKRLWEQRRTELGPADAPTLDALARLIDVCDPKSPEYLSYLEELYQGHLVNSGPERLFGEVYERALAAARTSDKALVWVKELYAREAARRDPNSEAMLVIQHNLAVFYNSRDAHAEAFVLLEPLVALERKLGKRLDMRVPSMNGLASALTRIGRHEEAIALSREILENIDALPEEQQNRYREQCYLILCDNYEECGQLDDAVVMAIRHLELIEASSGPDHLETAGELARVGKLLLKQERYADAEPWLRRCLAIRETQIPDEWHRYNAMSLLGGVLSGQGNYAEASPLLVGGYVGMNERKYKIPSGGLRSLAEAAQRLASFFEATSQPEMAVLWRDKAAELRPMGIVE